MLYILELLSLWLSLRAMDATSSYISRTLLVMHAGIVMHDDGITNGQPIITDHDGKETENDIAW